MDRVVTAFAQVGLDVTDNSGSMVEATTGAKSNLIGVKYERTVRALVLSRDAAHTAVLLRGGREGAEFPRGRLDRAR
jgi:hypothetical protein